MESMNLHIIGPGKLPDEQYFRVRWSILRQPLGLAIGTERLPDDDSAIHAIVEEAGEVLSVGRSHLIPEDSDGAMSDHAGEGASTCPAFTPLVGHADFPAANELRPAFHIRQMGTIEEKRRQGLAARILQGLEKASQQTWGCRSGWLQARIQAIPFYESQGWQIFGEEYMIDEVGPHFSMWKKF